MERKELSRHLAAILFTDIVGYTAMMQRDEQLALAMVRRHQEVLERMVSIHHGEVYQYYGDGSMSIFSSATQAVHCAFEIQKELLQTPVVHLRTGLHIGEIYTEGGKIFGDGVNIASRIESIGQGGAVLFSRDVYEKVRNHTTFQIKSIGKYEFKNVEDPVEVFALTNPEIITPDLKFIDGKLKVQPKKKKWSVPILFGGIMTILLAGYFLALRPIANGSSTPIPTNNKSIAVLPFKNLSDGSESDFLSIGITEDILTQLAQIHGLKVISRTSSLRFKDSKKLIKTIARELGVTTILEGSIRKYENNLRVSVQLINGMNESLIWAADFDREIEDVLNVQRDVALAVSDKLKIALSPELKNKLQDIANVDPEAYVNFQKGRELLLRSSGTLEDIEKAISYFEISIQEDSTFSNAWVGLGDAYMESIFWHRFSNDLAIPKAKKAVMKALALDPEFGEVYGLLGAIAYMERDYKEGEKYLRQAIAFSPNYTFAYERLAWILVMQKREEEAFAIFKKMLELDPLSTRNKGSKGNAYAVLGRYDEGIREMEGFLKTDPADNYLLWTLGYLQARNGDCEKAIETMNKRSIGTKTNWVLAYCYAKTGNKNLAEKFLLTNLEKSKTEFVPNFMLAVQYNALDNHQKALEHIEKSLESGEENFFIMSIDTDPMFESLRTYPEFKQLVEKVKMVYGGR